MACLIPTHYGRRPFRGRPGLTRRRGPPAAAPTTAPATRQFGRDRGQIGVDRRECRAAGGLVNPFIRIQTSEPLEEPVAFLRRPGPAHDALGQLRVAPAEAGRLARSRHSGHDRSISGAARPRAARRSRRALTPGLAVLHVAPRALARQGRPVEVQIGMRVLERLGHLVVERLTTDLEVDRRSKQVEHARAMRRIRRGPVRVHHDEAFKAALVARMADERQPDYLFLALRAAFELRDLDAVVADRALFRTGLDPLAFDARRDVPAEDS